MIPLISLIKTAEEMKPPMDAPCNHCGWCCLTEVCSMGEYYGASSKIPCEFLLSSKKDKHYCELIVNGTMEKKVMRIGKGCDAKTQKEVFTDFNIQGAISRCLE